MHLCPEIDTDFDDFGKIIFKPVEARTVAEPLAGEAQPCPMCRQMRSRGAARPDGAWPSGVERMVRKLMDVPFPRLGIYPDIVRRRRGDGRSD